MIDCSCFTIDDHFYLVKDLSQKCWTSYHLTWALGGALPGILVWGIGIPLSALLILYRFRFELDKDKIKERCGYKSRNYYWESVIMFRKVAMIFITVFLSSLGKIVQALAVIILLILYLFLTMRMKPYFTRRLNQLETASILTSSITIYSGVFFLSSRETTDPSFTPNVDSESYVTLVNLSEETKWVLVIAILLSNLTFLFFWVWYFFKDLRRFLANKALRVFRLCCVCCRFSRLEESWLRVLKSEQDAEIAN